MKHNYIKIQDFLNDDSFVKWVVFSENQEEWQQFLLENPNKKRIVEEARQLIFEINSIENSNGTELNQKLVYEKITKEINKEKSPNKPVIKFLIPTIFMRAASFVLILSLVYFFYENQSKGKVTYKALVASMEDENTLIERVNNSKSSIKIKLEDSSIIILEKGSKLSYPSHFAINKRVVVLSGEAFFDIENNPNKPYYVYANVVVTKVLGTSFRIKANEQDKKVIVKVSTGKVSVYNQREINLNDPETNALILLPNQQAIYNRPSEGLSKHLVEIPMLLTEKLDKNVPTQFDEVSVNQIFEVIEKRYGIKLIFNEELLSKCIITTKFRDESLYDQLDLICSIIGGTYKEVDAQIVIESKGCK
jgi:hypothetical protein